MTYDCVIVGAQFLYRPEGTVLRVSMYWKANRPGILRDARSEIIGSGMRSNYAAAIGPEGSMR